MGSVTGSRSRKGVGFFVVAVIQSTPAPCIGPIHLEVGDRLLLKETVLMDQSPTSKGENLPNWTFGAAGLNLRRITIKMMFILSVFGITIPYPKNIPRGNRLQSLGYLKVLGRLGQRHHFRASLLKL